MILKNALITTINNQFLGYVVIEKDKIKSVHHGSTDEHGIDCQKNILLPSFIDSHTHGGYGWSFNDMINDNYEKSLVNYEKKLLLEGVGGVLATTVTCSKNDLKKLAVNYAAFLKQKRVIKYFGWYIEGPFISLEKKGAHEADLITTLDEKFLKFLKTKFKSNLVYFTIAPENNNFELIKKYNDHFIFCVGHSNDFSHTSAWLASNFIKRITHLFNAMSGFFHNKTGIVNAIFETKKFKDDFCIELISDGYHVRNEVIEFTYKTLTTNNLSIVSDSLPAKGLKNGFYKLNNLEIVKKNNVFYLKDLSSLAGSGMKYNKVVAHFKKVTNCTWSEVVLISSYNSAKNFYQENQYGNIAKNYVANLVLIDKNFNVKLHVINGIIVYQKKNN